VSVGLKSFGSRFGDLEVISAIVRFGTFLLFDVCHDRFIGDVTTGGDEVPASPQVPTPELFLEVSEFLQQFTRALALDVLHDLTRREIRWTRQQHMNVIPRNGALQNLDVVRTADFANQFAKSHPYRTRQYRLAILRHPYKVVLDVITTMSPDYSPVRIFVGGWIQIVRCDCGFSMWLQRAPFPPWAWHLSW